MTHTFETEKGRRFARWLDYQFDRIEKGIDFIDNQILVTKLVDRCVFGPRIPEEGEDELDPND